MERLALKVLNCLFGVYPDFMELEKCRERSNLSESDFLRVVAYLQEKAFIELEEPTRGVATGIYGRARITSAGIDTVDLKSKKVKVSVIRQ
ncbi:MAG: hypothetical protein Q4F74_02805 [Synergistaceae bacterium]|nr:hypothetical protein [Synergistaceae bacterium]